MPTDEQLYESWRSQIKLGLSDSQVYCDDYSKEPVNQRNYQNKSPGYEYFNGRYLGKIVLSVDENGHEQLNVIVDGPEKD